MSPQAAQLLLHRPLPVCWHGRNRPLSSPRHRMTNNRTRRPSRIPLPRTSTDFADPRPTEGLTGIWDESDNCPSGSRTLTGSQVVTTRSADGGIGQRAQHGRISPTGPQTEMEVLRDGSVETGCGVRASAPQRRSDVVDVHLARLDHRLGMAARRPHRRQGRGRGIGSGWLRGRSRPPRRRAGRR